MAILINQTQAKGGSPEYKVGHYEINEGEAKNVKDIFKWVADDGLTLRCCETTSRAGNISS